MTTSQGQPRGLDALLAQAPEEIREDWGNLIRSTVTGGVWAREAELAPKYRSMITIAALTALNREHELALHIRGGLMRGLTRQEIAEIIMHMAIYGGFPVAVEGMRVAKQVFDQVDATA
jgi:4-carboxymuconolactone decarboxylase